MFDQNNDLRLNPREFLHMVVHLISQKKYEVKYGCTDLHAPLEYLFKLFNCRKTSKLTAQDI